MNFDPTLRDDRQIAEHAESAMRDISAVGRAFGLEAGEIIPAQRGIAKIDAARVMTRTGGVKRGLYVDVTAITPTPLGEGKTTTTIGLVQGLGRLGLRAAAAIRQPSAGPTFNIKGSAAGGGWSQCVPAAPLSLGFTGDIDAVTNAHNLGMVALTARMQHEANYDNARLQRIGWRRLDIDPERVQTRWAMDFCAQALRQIRIGLGGSNDGLEMASGFQISVSSELMAILAVARDLADVRNRVARMVLAYDRRGREVTAHDLEVDGAMTAWLVNAVNPNMIQTIEGQPVFVHAGPFANIAIGQSSILADRVGVALGDALVTESGFGSDIGYEKFWNLKCRKSGLTPDAVVIVATVRALKMHGGGPEVKPGKKLDEAYTRENLALLEQGFANLAAHIAIVRRSGIRPVVCINDFHTDTPAEHRLLIRRVEQEGALCAVSRHWKYGGDGARDLAEAVRQAASEPKSFRFLYDMDLPVRDRIDRIAREVYGAGGVTYTPEAEARMAALDGDPATRELGLCMVKTHLSLSHDPARKGRPAGWMLPVRDVMVFRGAGFLVPITGEIRLMPGTGSNANFRRIDVDVNTGRVTGLM
ncbi:MAG: formate--tetrahydrofolate ligase [Kiritimatiellae bacterium]|nr:formate--tetrahydrofolate ligase [Kiritimatiellia bacterium]